MPSLDVALVIPAFNEEDCITQVVESWLGTLTSLHLDFVLTVIDDGSTDGTAAALAVFQGDARVAVISKPNAGHGPTVLEGYRQAVHKARWIFQCDADNEIAAEQFPALWQERDGRIGVFGVRTGRVQGRARALISAASRTVIRLVFGSGVDDVNVPFRLMRSDVLAELLPLIPPNTLAPNLLIAGAFAATHAPVSNVPVAHTNRATGAVSITSWRLWRLSFIALMQILARGLRVRAFAIKNLRPVIANG